MSGSRYFLFHSLLIVSFALAFPIHAQVLPGFIGIDCGLLDDSSYPDPQTDMNYISDAPYVQTGLSMKVLSEFKDSVPQRYWTLRSFPEGDQNCYNLTLKKGDVYLIRSGFMYGNYDEKNVVPKFDVYLGPNFFFTVNLETAANASFYDIIHVLQSKYLYVCLVNTGNGIPFISSLELIPLKNTTYPVQSQLHSLNHIARYDVGLISNEAIRYPTDDYDRYWWPYERNDWAQINTSLGIASNGFDTPSVVMSTAGTPVNASEPMKIFMSSSTSSDTFYVYMHFTEVKNFEVNESREFVIYLDSDVWGDPFTPEYLVQTTIYNQVPLKDINFTIQRTNGSTLPPILNAFEIFSVAELLESQTNERDVDAIVNIKSMYGLKRNWQGDPCNKKFLWEGLNCSYIDARRIISLNLSSSNLNGGIPPYIANLSLLQHLDLSDNHLTGTVPELLSDLQFLTFLNLSRNMLNGTVPAKLKQRADQGSLDLFVDGSFCESDSCTLKKKKNNTKIVPIVATVASVLSVLIIALAILWKFQRRKLPAVSSPKKNNANSRETDQLQDSSKNRQFRHVQIQMMTNNFATVVGEGGFGTVFHGYLDGTQVAVKMLSPSSVQGYQQFRAEVEILLRVHHRNLTKLIGYCDDGTNMGLIYEYMAKGNLAEYLKDNSRGVLNWERRVGIALGAAQGLEYLHSDCEPPIIHRDIKSTNILLTESFQAKISDFGLSKAFPLGGVSYISTVVAGTFGYLDPEYLTSKKLTQKSDVYSFGVVLSEIITSQPVLMNNNRTHISEWVSSMLSSNGDIKTVADPRLEGDFDSTSMDKAVELAMACVSPTSTKRPNMSYVVTKLNECLSAEIEYRNHNIQLAQIEAIPLISKA